MTSNKLTIGHGHQMLPDGSVDYPLLGANPSQCVASYWYSKYGVEMSSNE
jgi:hypothetical protein